MARGKPTRSKEKKALQKVRTAKNQVRRYERNISQRPEHPHVKVWATKRDSYASVLTA